MELNAVPDLNTPVREMARPDPVRLLEVETVSQALARLRSESIGERIVYFYVVDNAGKLVGVVPTRRLLLCDPLALVGEIMVHPVLSVGEAEPFASALEKLTARRLLALPVVDSAGRLSGVLDISTATRTLFDLERKEAADEIFQIVGLNIAQERSRTLWWVLRKRFPWLLMNLASGLLAAVISHLFDAGLKAVVAVAFFIPLVLTLAESVAMQTVTMSLESIHLSRRPGSGRGRPALRELRVGMILGLVSAAIVAALAFTWLGLAGLAAVVAGGIVVAGTTGAAFGYSIPRLVHRLRLDPKIASGPAVLALTDIAALFFYLGLAAFVLA